MKRLFCKAKIHRATVTEADLDYIGSITIDQILMREADIKPFEMVQVTSLKNATRWKTYAIPGEENSGVICLNGPPAHLFSKGDKVIILSMGLFDEKEMNQLKPKMIFVDKENKITNIKTYSIAKRGEGNNEN